VLKKIFTRGRITSFSERVKRLTKPTGLWHIWLAQGKRGMLGAWTKRGEVDRIMTASYYEGVADWRTKGENAMRFKVVLEPSDEGGFTIYIPSLPGCISEGDTVEDALKNIEEAAELYLEPVEDDWVLDEQTLVKEIEL
jgi:predicted RNase H-like HicB family nuclease